MDLSLITSASASLGVLKTIASGLVSVRDTALLGEVKIQLIDQVLSLQQTMLEITARLAALEEEKRAAETRVRELEAKIAERTGRVPYEIYPGKFVMAGAHAEGRQPQPPYLCQACYAKGIETILQFESETPHHHGYYRCTNGGTAHKLEMGGDKPFRPVIA